jgi:hypothetical protein
MVCPFSGKLCRECALYRGRHYFLCFEKHYRGYMNKDGKLNKQNTKRNFGKQPKELFHLDALTETKSIDPYTVEMPDIK